MKSLFAKYKVYLITLAVLLIYVLCAFALKMPCPIKYLTGISCAGCGMSRALMSALTLDFSEAFRYHPLWITVPTSAVALAVLGANGKKRASTVLLVCLAALFLITWIVRLVTGDEIVKFDLAQGALARLLNKE